MSYTERVPGSILDAKNSMLIWRYHLCDLEFGRLMAKELADHLKDILKGYNVDTRLTKDVVECRWAGVNKGVAVEKIMQHGMCFYPLLPPLLSFCLH